MQPDAFDRYSDLIGSIYDCVIEPARWPEVLGAIRESLNLANAIMALQAMPSGAPLMLVSSGAPQEMLASIPELSSDAFELWGGPDRIGRFPLDEPVVQSHQTPRATWRANRWNMMWGERLGIFDVVAFKFASDHTMVGNIAFGRAATAGEIGDAELAALRLIAPHVRRAVAISRLLDLKSVALATFAAAVDALAAGVALVDAGMHCIYLNPAAERLTGAVGPLVTAGGRIAASDQAATEALASAVKLAATDESKLGRRGLGIPVRNDGGEPFVIHVLPLGRRDVLVGLSQSAVAALFVARADAGPQLPADALALLYDLTPAEARIVLLVAGGRSQADIARDLGVMPSTVKTHLLHVFDKTGCRRQAELVRLIGSLSAPV